MSRIIAKTLFDPTIEQRFQDFHSANPHVFERIIELLSQVRARGKYRVGMKMIFEVLRWEYFLRTDRPEGEFLLNNDFSSRYSRMVASTRPDLGALLEVRKLRAV